MIARQESPKSPSKPAHKGIVWLPVTNEVWAKYSAGLKTVEIRQDAPRWRGVVPGIAFTVRRGYSTPDEFRGVVGRVARASCLDNLPWWAVDGANIGSLEKIFYFDPSKPLIAMEVHK